MPSYDKDFEKDGRVSSDSERAESYTQHKQKGVLGFCKKNKWGISIIALILAIALGLGLYSGLKRTEAKGEDTSLKNVVSNMDEGYSSAWDRIGSNETETASSSSSRVSPTGSAVSALSDKVASATKEVTSSSASATANSLTPTETSTVV